MGAMPRVAGQRQVQGALFLEETAALLAPASWELAPQTESRDRRPSSLIDRKDCKKQLTLD